MRSRTNAENTESLTLWRTLYDLIGDRWMHGTGTCRHVKNDVTLMLRLASSRMLRLPGHIETAIADLYRTMEPDWTEACKTGYQVLNCVVPMLSRDLRQRSPDMSDWQAINTALRTIVDTLAQQDIRYA